MELNITITKNNVLEELNNIWAGREHKYWTWASIYGGNSNWGTERTKN